ncbi:hypothetical protein bcgnr5384_51120 [Bacillus cereus]
MLYRIKTLSSVLNVRKICSSFSVSKNCQEVKSSKLENCDNRVLFFKLIKLIYDP